MKNSRYLESYEKDYKKAELIGADIRSRKNADHIRNSIADCAGEVKQNFVRWVT